MKVVLLGGAGLFGRTVINAYAAHLPETCEFVIADYDYRTARKMARRLGDRFSARMVDASSPESLDKAARDGSVIVSLVGPWYRFGEQVIEGSMRGGHPIVAANMARVSIGGGKEELLKEKGIPCITGVSLLPGALDLIAGSLIEAYPRAGEV
ncbi:MAG: hypothetical protein GTN70_00860, partial [Deltaproteobacteria bacterium]|nr:hypothetical protein [Deltaproteobacteria bacterium]NIS76204.1 hypothetical protein [Deltaproteobacteria bacterium]